MNKKIHRLLIAFVLSLTIAFAGYGQSQPSVSVQDLQYTNNGQPTISPGNCGNINLASSTSTTISLGINLSKPVQQAIGTSDLYVYTQKSSSDYRVQRIWNIVQGISWTQPSSGNSTFSLSTSFSINSSDFNVSGGTLFVVLKSSGGIEYQSCSYSITKTQTPIFNLSPASISVACGSTSPVTFSVTNVYNSPGNVTYSWNAAGWSGAVNSSSSSVTLTPSSTTSLPSTVYVTPYLNGVAQPTRSCSVTRASLVSGKATIFGDSPICTTSDYRINNLPAGLTVTWSIPPNAQPALQLAPNVPNPGQVRITNQNVGLITTTLTATISGAACGQEDVVLTRTISNDNQLQFPFRQEACGSNAPRSGIVSGALDVVPDCMVYVDLGAESRIVTRVGGGPQIIWGTSRSVDAPYSNTLFFQLPVGATGIPFTFNITGGDGCGSTSLIFRGRTFMHDPRYLYEVTPRYLYEATPIPAADEVTITAKQNEKYLGKTNFTKASQPLSYTVEVYELTTGTRKILQRNVAGSLTNRINITTLRPGYYILHISDGQTSQKIKIYKE